MLGSLISGGVQKALGQPKSKNNRQGNSIASAISQARGPMLSKNNRQGNSIASAISQAQGNNLPNFGGPMLGSKGGGGASPPNFAGPMLGSKGGGGIVEGENDWLWKVLGQTPQSQMLGLSLLLPMLGGGFFSRQIGPRSITQSLRRR